MNKVSVYDEKNLSLVRKNVSEFMEYVAEKYDKEDALLLDIAPQIHEGAAPHFKKTRIRTLDLDKDSGATYIADLCDNNESLIPDETFDFIVCTEVLEHTLQPFDAATEIKRMLKKGGIVFVSAPYDLRIHGPLPDCWRFTEHGLRALFKGLNIIELKSLDNPDRFLMPVHYTLIARKKDE